ncbi:MAG: GPW/gp25 family protein [Bacteroidales bacterium]|nr:GPW/gp25 family protein [Bacteroidales bacterium]
MTKIIKSFLGTGWGFPPAFSNKTSDIGMLSDVDDIQSSLEILLTTRPGERVMRPDYGCNLDELVFEPLTTTFKTYIKDLISTAILYYEPRIEVNSIDLDDTGELEGRILIVIDYTVSATNTRFNFVYPFYKNEATDLK